MADPSKKIGDIFHFANQKKGGGKNNYYRKAQNITKSQYSK